MVLLVLSVFSTPLLWANTQDWVLPESKPHYSIACQAYVERHRCDNSLRYDNEASAYRHVTAKTAAHIQALMGASDKHSLITLGPIELVEQHSIGEVKYYDYHYTWERETRWNTQTISSKYRVATSAVNSLLRCPSSHSQAVDFDGGGVDICVRQKQCPENQPSEDSAGNPIMCATGQKVQADIVYSGEGPDALSHSTYYASALYDDDSDSLNFTFDSYQGRQRADNNYRVLNLLYEGSEGKVYQITYGSGTSDVFYGAHDATHFQSTDKRAGSLSVNNSLNTQTMPSGATFTYNSNGNLVSRTSVKGQTRIYTYDALGRLSVITNHFGKTLQYAYNTNDLLETIMTPEGDSYGFEYDARGNLTKVVYPDDTPAISSDNPTLVFLYEDSRFPSHLTGKINENGVRYATWSYDNKGRATSSAHGENLERVEFDYSVAGQTRLTTFVSTALSSDLIYHYETINIEGSPRKRLVRLEQIACTDCVIGDWYYDYNSLGYVERSFSPSGNVTTYSYDNVGLETRRTEAKGTADEKSVDTNWQEDSRRVISTSQGNLKTEYTYDAQGQIVSTTLTDLVTNQTRVTRYTYNSDGLLIEMDGSRTDLGDTTTYAYDGNGNVNVVTDPLGYVTAYDNYDGHGRPGKVTDANGVITILTYTPRGWLSSFSTHGITTAYDYFPTGSLKSITTGNGHVIQYEYDEGERLIAIIDGQGNRIEYTRDLMGNITETQIKGEGGQLAYSHQATFNALGQLKKMTGSNGQSASFAYDKDGVVVEVKDGNSNSTVRAVDALNRVVQEIDRSLNTSRFTYDSQGRVATVADQRGLVTSYTYNAYGDLTEQNSPDTGTTVFAYDQAGNLIQRTDARGETVSYSYDALNRLVRESYASDATEDVIYTYDQASNGVGRLTQVQDDSGQTNYSYNELGYLVTKTTWLGGVSYSTGYSYDEAGNLTQVVYPSGRIVDLGLDALGRINDISTRERPNAISETVVQSVRYLPFGPVESFTYGNGIRQSFGYDQDYRISSITSRGYSGVLNRLYRYDLNNNITDILDYERTEKSQNFSYDTLDRLSSAGGDYGQVAYEYDAVGNRTRRQISTNASITIEDYIYSGVANQLNQIVGSSQGTRDFSYDEAGNQLSGKTSEGEAINHKYNAANRPDQAIGPNGTAYYKHNALGQRVVIQAGDPLGARHYHYDERGSLIAVSDENAKTEREYLYLGVHKIAMFVEDSEAPIDTDDDGVFDDQDLCPATQTGDVVNVQGCSENQQIQ